MLQIFINIGKYWKYHRTTNNCAILPNIATCSRILPNNKKMQESEIFNISAKCSYLLQNYSLIRHICTYVCQMMRHTAKCRQFTIPITTNNNEILLNSPKYGGIFRNILQNLAVFGNVCRFNLVLF